MGNSTNPKGGFTPQNGGAFTPESGGGGLSQGPAQDAFTQGLSQGPAQDAFTPKFEQQPQQPQQQPVPDFFRQQQAQPSVSRPFQQTGAYNPQPIPHQAASVPNMYNQGGGIDAYAIKQGVDALTPEQREQNRANAAMRWGPSMRGYRG